MILKSVGLTQVGGGIAHGTSVFDTLVKETSEEASLSSDVVRTRAVAAGAVSYFYVRESSAGGEEGLLQPEVQYVYDLALEGDIIPEPSDDEVETFRLMPLPEVFPPDPVFVLTDNNDRYRSDLQLESLNPILL